MIVQKMNYLKLQKMMRWPLQLLFSLLNLDLLPVQELLIVQLQAVVLLLQITHGWHGFASLSVFYLSSCFWLTSFFVQPWHVHALKVRSLKRNPRSTMTILSMNHNTGKIIQAYTLRISIRSVISVFSSFSTSSKSTFFPVLKFFSCLEMFFSIN